MNNTNNKSDVILSELITVILGAVIKLSTDLQELYDHEKEVELIKGSINDNCLQILKEIVQAKKNEFEITDVPVPQSQPQKEVSL